MYGNSDATTPDVRVMAAVKFVLAAVLQWSPTSYSFRFARFIEADSPVLGAGGHDGNELCPTWSEFFHEIAQADDIVYRWNTETASMLTESRVEQVNELLTVAEAKLMWLQGLLHFITCKGEYVGAPHDVELQPWMIHQGWNRFCLSIVRGASLDSTVVALRPHDKLTGFKFVSGLPKELATSGGKRFWFPFSAPRDSEPWMEKGSSFSEHPVQLLGPCAVAHHERSQSNKLVTLPGNDYTPNLQTQERSSPLPDSTLE